MMPVMTPAKDDALTIAAIAILAAFTVTFAHEGLGHGVACLALGGHVTQLSSSLFQCDAHSPWIDLAGPGMNLLVGTLALLLSRAGRPGAWRFYLIFITTFSYFWEGGYLVQAMLTRQGDLYFFAENIIGTPDLWWRIAGGLAGLTLYLLNIRLISGAVLALWPRDKAQRAARIGWVAATGATILAALTYHGGFGQNLHDTVMEIGVASLPLMLTPWRASSAVAAPFTLARSPIILILALFAFVVFIFTQGHGLG